MTVIITCKSSLKKALCSGEKDFSCIGMSHMASGPWFINNLDVALRVIPENFCVCLVQWYRSVKDFQDRSATMSLSTETEGRPLNLMGVKFSIYLFLDHWTI